MEFIYINKRGKRQFCKHYRILFWLFYWTTTSLSVLTQIRLLSLLLLLTQFCHCSACMTSPVRSTYTQTHSHSHTMTKTMTSDKLKEVIKMTKTLHTWSNRSSYGLQCSSANLEVLIGFHGDKRWMRIFTDRKAVNMFFCINALLQFYSYSIFKNKKKK